jgi:hypothetical protein
MSAIAYYRSPIEVIALCAALLFATGPTRRAAAQVPTAARTHNVGGVVFDSIGHVPLAAAVVQVVPLDSPDQVTTDTTDSNGRFRFVGLPSGRYVIGFYHEALNSLGLDAPQRTFELTPTTSGATIDLAIPSGAVVRALRCGGDSAERHDGLLAGMVRDAKDRVAVDGATVAVEWLAIARDSGNYRQVIQRAVASVDASGTYAVCGVPVDAPVTVRLTRPGFRPIVGPAFVPTAGAARQNFRLADSAAARGAASIIGRVVRQDGRPLATGRAVVAALERELPIQNGTFTVNDVPPGTWAVEIRSIGFDPQSFFVDAAEGGNNSTTITISDRPVQLDAVTVVGKETRETKILTDVLFRKRYGSGTVFLPDNFLLKGAMFPTDVLRAARGFFANKDPDSIKVRGCEYPPQRRTTTTRGKTIKVYVDGALYPPGIAGLNSLIRASDILAIEAYPDLVGVPPQWRTSDACALVIVWTKR